MVVGRNCGNVIESLIVGIGPVFGVGRGVGVEVAGWLEGAVVSVRSGIGSWLVGSGTGCEVGPVVAWGVARVVGARVS